MGKRLRYGICTGLGNLKQVEALGFDYIEPSVTSIADLSEEELKEYQQELEKSSISCEVFNILFPKTMALIGKCIQSEEIKEYLERVIARVALLNGKIIVFGSGKCRNCESDMSYRAAYEQLKEVVSLTGEIAARHGITIVIEPLNRKETNMICSMNEGAILCADVAMENVGLLSDYFHVVTDKDHFEDMKIIREFGHIHIASGEGRKFPLSPEYESYDTLFEVLAEIGYHGRISIEGKTDDLEKDGRTALQLLYQLEEKAYGQG